MGEGGEGLLVCVSAYTCSVVNVFSLPPVSYTENRASKDFIFNKCRK